jgi:flagellar hook-associated protein 3 FlgL
MLNDAALAGILQDQSQLSKTQNELSSGLSINSPSDNPVAEVQLLQLTAASSQDQQYLSNGQSASTSLSLEQQALSNATSTLQSVQGLLVQANNATNTPADLKDIATEIQQLEQQLMGVANSQDAQGQYLFGGYAVNTQPFARGSTGSVSYLGDSGVRSVQLDGGTSVQTGDAGSSVFMNIPGGNGTFTVSASAGNTGTGVVDAGTVTDPSAWVPDQYTVSFTSPIAYQVTNSAGTVVSTGSYDPSTGGSISFDGIEVGLNGAPATGDTFTIAPSGRQSVFDTLDSVVSALSNAGSSTASRARLSSMLAGAQQQLSQAMSQVSNVTTSVGTRLSLISSLKTSVSTQSTTVQTQISSVDSLNYAAATSQYSQEYLALQAAEQSYAQLGQLSLFKYL